MENVRGVLNIHWYFNVLKCNTVKHSICEVFNPVISMLWGYLQIEMTYASWDILPLTFLFTTEINSISSHSISKRMLNLRLFQPMFPTLLNQRVYFWTKIFFVTIVCSKIIFCNYCVFKKKILISTFSRVELIFGKFKVFAADFSQKQIIEKHAIAKFLVCSIYLLLQFM